MELHRSPGERIERVGLISYVSKKAFDLSFVRAIPVFALSAFSNWGPFPIVKQKSTAREAHSALLGLNKQFLTFRGMDNTEKHAGERAGSTQRREEATVVCVTR